MKHLFFALLLLFTSVNVLASSAFPNSAGSSLPSQGGNSGKFLTTDGTNASWATASASPGGSSSQAQWNSSSAFAGSSALLFDSTHVSMPVSSGLRMDGLSDANWQIGLNLGIITHPHIATNAIEIIVGGGSSDGFTIGNNGGTAYLELDHNADAWFSHNLNVHNRYLIGANSSTVAANYSLSNVVLGAVAKGTDAAENLAFFGSSDSSSPLGLAIRNENSSTANNRTVDLQANDIGNVVRTLRLNPDGGDVNIQSIVGGVIYDNSHLDSINIGNRNLIRSNGIALDWNQDQLIDEGSVKSFDWNVRQAFATDGTSVNADWNDPTFIKLNNPHVVSDGTNDMMDFFDVGEDVTYGKLNSIGQIEFGNGYQTAGVVNLAGQTFFVPEIASSITLTLDFTGNGYTQSSDGTIYSRTMYNTQNLNGVLTYSPTGVDGSYTEQLNPGLGSLIATINYSETGYVANGSCYTYDLWDTYNGNYANADTGNSVQVCDDSSSNPYGIDITWTPPGAAAQATAIIVHIDDGTFIDLGGDTGAYTDNGSGWSVWPGPSGTVTWNFDYAWTNTPISVGVRLLDNTQANYVDEANPISSFVDDNSEWTAGANVTPNSFAAHPLDVYGLSLFQAANGSDIPVIVKGAGGQSADLTEWQNSSGTVLAKIDNGGDIFGADGSFIAIGITQTANNAQDLVISQKSGQFGDMVQFRNPSFGVFSGLTATGDYYTNAGTSFTAGKNIWNACSQVTSTTNSLVNACNIAVTSNYSHLYTVQCVARKDSTHHVFFKKSASFFNEGGGVVQVGSVVSDFIENANDTNAQMIFTPSANNLLIQVDASSSTTWKWDCSYQDQYGGS